MNRDWDEVIQRYIDGIATDEETFQLQEMLRGNQTWQRRYLEFISLDVALEATVEANELTRMQGKIQAAGPRSVSRAKDRRPMVAAVIGLIMGLAGASMVWAITAPKFAAISIRLAELIDGSFESQLGRIGSGFPRKLNVWSGDEAEIVESPAEIPKSGRRMLRFLKAEREEEVAHRVDFPRPDPASCDLFQLIDLRPIRNQIAENVDAELELSANFLDTRNPTTIPVRFICHIRLFEGSPESMHELWPSANHESVGSGAGKMESFGGHDTKNHWKRLVARCVLPRSADFAVVWIAAARSRSGESIQSELGYQYVDDVQLLLKTQPFLPTRMQ